MSQFLRLRNGMEWDRSGVHEIYCLLLRECTNMEVRKAFSLKVGVHRKNVEPIFCETQNRGK